MNIDGVILAGGDGRIDRKRHTNFAREWSSRFVRL